MSRVTADNIIFKDDLTYEKYSCYLLPKYILRSATIMIHTLRVNTSYELSDRL